MSVTNRRLPSWTALATLVIPLVVGGLFMIVRKGFIVYVGYSLLFVAGFILLAKLLTWEPIWTRLAFVRIKVQASGKMEPLLVKFRLSYLLKVHMKSAFLYVDKIAFELIDFYQEDDKISGAVFAIPTNWFKGKTKKAYIRIVSAKGREWHSNDFEIKV